jgi:pimeloyl-ACP methyl ester carboxylesterase
MSPVLDPDVLRLTGDPAGFDQPEADAACEIAVRVQGEGPLIVCVHGWPELWYSWRHQLAEFGGPGGGYRVAALDVRGYGDSSAPHAVAEYSLTKLAADVAAVIDQLSDDGSAILFGHDWGAPIVWNTARLHPERVRAVAGLSVPYIPITPGNPLDFWRATFTEQGRFFYQVYFEQEGVAEAEFEADSRDALTKIYYGASHDGMGQREVGFLSQKPADATMLEGLVDPDPLPAWLTDHDLDVYTAAFTRSGWRGPLNRYRAQWIDGDQIGSLPNPNLSQPATFIVGESDPTGRFIPGVNLSERAEQHCDDFRGATVIAEAGHWVQQEKPEATNQALRAFLNELD